MMISAADFEKLDIRVGTILSAADFPAAKKPAYQLTIDFGALGTRRSSAQITQLYSPEELNGKQVIAIVNLPPKQIARFFSECLVLGVYDSAGAVILLQPAGTVPNGSKVR